MLNINRSKTFATDSEHFSEKKKKNDSPPSPATLQLHKREIKEEKKHKFSNAIKHRLSSILQFKKKIGETRERTVNRNQTVRILCK